MSANEEYREFVKDSPGYCGAEGFAPLPPEATWTNGEIKEQPRARSIYDEFTEVEVLLRAAMVTLSLDESYDAIRRAASKVLALKERVCALKPEQREAAKRYRVTVCDSSTGEAMFLGVVEAGGLKEAEQHAIAKATLNHRCNPLRLDARFIHELCPACGQEKGGES